MYLIHNILEYTLCLDSALLSGPAAGKADRRVVGNTRYSPASRADSPERLISAASKASKHQMDDGKLVWLLVGGFRIHRLNQLDCRLVSRITGASLRLSQLARTGRHVRAGFEAVRLVWIVVGQMDVRVIRRRFD